MRSARQHHRKLLAEISVTPLLDLVFILLFAFMVALPLVSRSDALMGTAPELSTMQNRPPSEVVTLRVREAGEFLLEGAVITSSEIEKRLQTEWLPAKPDLGVRVEIAPEQPVSALSEVMTMLSRAGVRRTSIQVASGS